MNSLRKISPILLFGLFAASCGRPEGPRYSPELPLTKPQAELLSKIEKMPKPERKVFAAKHMKEIIGFSEENKTFGDRMNAAMGIKPPAN